MTIRPHLPLRKNHNCSRPRVTLRLTLRLTPSVPLAPPHPTPSPHTHHPAQGLANMVVCCSGAEGAEGSSAHQAHDPSLDPGLDREESGLGGGGGGGDYDLGGYSDQGEAGGGVGDEEDWEAHGGGSIGGAGGEEDGEEQLLPLGGAGLLQGLVSL